MTTTPALNDDLYAFREPQPFRIVFVDCETKLEAEITIKDGVMDFGGNMPMTDAAKRFFDYVRNYFHRGVPETELAKDWWQRLGFVNDRLYQTHQLARMIAELRVFDAQRLESQSKEIEALRSALEPFAKLAENYEGSGPSDWVGYKGAVYVSDLRRARTALKGA